MLAARQVIASALLIGQKHMLRRAPLSRLFLLLAKPIPIAAYPEIDGNQQDCHHDGRSGPQPAVKENLPQVAVHWIPTRANLRPNRPPKSGFQSRMPDSTNIPDAS